MGDYFDDEDLIVDYMEEDFEPPPDYDEAFDESDLVDSKNVDAEERKTEAEPMEEEDPPASQDQEEEDTNDLRALYTTVPRSVQVTKPDRKTDVYSFERYQGDWRAKDKAPTDTLTAKQWKRHGFEKAALWEETKAQLMDPGRGRKPSAPDAQLVEYWNRHQVRNQRWGLAETSGMCLRPVEGDPSVSVKLGDGTYVHVRKSPARPVTKEMGTTIVSGPILSVSMAELIRRSDAILRKAERQKQTRPPCHKEAKVSKDDDGSEPVSDEAEEEKVQRGPTKHDTNSHLWVDKHAPSTFSHLLSDDRTNREVLRALRAWDPYVFRKDAPARPTFVQQNQHASEQEAKRSYQSEDKSLKKQSNDVRPDESNRVILLSGPPGVGKTTLAHIIACHAGYRPMEVNASDERSASVLKDRVTRAMESSTLNMPSKSGKVDDLAGRPNCIILDEIDGADAKSAISALVEIIRAELPPPGSSKGGKHKKPYLRRPIIFICNHKYAPALRPLLPFAKQFDVAPPAPTRLVARLRSVLAAENLSVFGGSSLLSQLVGGTSGDVRSCLYALQFAAARARELARKKEANETNAKGKALLVDISSSLKAALGGTGMKDERNDVSATVTAVFRKTMERNVGDSVHSRGRPARVERVLQLVESFGDNSKILDCLFTNLLQVSYVDPTLDRCTLAHEWLSSADIYRSNKTAVASNNHMEHHGMQRQHMPAAAAAVHLLCRVETRPDLTFSSRRMTDARYQLEANDNLAHKFIEGLSPSARGGASHGSAAIETIPFSLWMLSAGEGSFSLNRAVSTLEILNRDERLAFESHVATLRSLGLTYVANEEVSLKPNYDKSRPPTMRLEPQVDRLIQFEELRVPPTRRRKQIPSALKELLAHRAAVEGMRDNENKVSRQSPSGIPSKQERKLQGEAAAKDKLLQEPHDPSASASPPINKKKLDTSVVSPPAKRPKTLKASANFLGLGAAKAKAARTARKAALVGFDKTKRLKVSNSGSGIPFNQVMRYKYQKGFTQAVRTPCKLEALV